MKLFCKTTFLDVCPHRLRMGSRRSWIAQSEDRLLAVDEIVKGRIVPSSTMVLVDGIQLVLVRLEDCCKPKPVEGDGRDTTTACAIISWGLGVAPLSQ